MESTLYSWSEKKRRWYKRKFDHDEAKRLYATGDWTVTKLAERFGVSQVGMRRVVRDGMAARMADYTREYYKGTCEGCGAECVSADHPSKKSLRVQRAMCVRCAALDRTDRVRYDELGAIAAIRCLECQKWKHPELFPRGQRNKTSRAGGIHSQCRQCGTKARQNYRERHKVPCVTCGAPCLPQSEKGARAKDTGLCRPCWVKQNGFKRRKVAA